MLGNEHRQNQNLLGRKQVGNQQFFARVSLSRAGCHPPLRRTAVDREWKNSEHEQWEEWISVRLRRKEGIAWGDAHEEWGGIKARELWAAATALPGHLREVTEQVFRLTQEGWFVENEVLVNLYQKT